MRSCFLSAFSLVCLIGPLSGQSTAPQTWTSSDGRAMQARFVRLEGETVVLEKDGSVIQVPLARLNAASAAQAKTLGGGPPPAPGVMQGSAAVPVLKKMSPDFSRGFTNSLGMKFIPVRGTEVLFCLHETRRKDYAAFAATVPGVDDKWKAAVHKTTEAGPAIVAPAGDQDDHPVCSVNYADAEAFCDWLSKGEGLKYRLPTGSEWCEAAGLQDAVKAEKDGSLTYQPPGRKNTFKYFWGPDFPPPAGTGNFADDAYGAKYPGVKTIPGYADSFATTSPVMSFKPGERGIYDLAGNVAEWCDKVLEGQPPTSNIGTLRGRDFRTSTESYFRPLSTEPMPRPVRAEFIGFRVVVEKTR